MIIIEAASWEKESLLHMQTAQVQARLRMRAVSSEPMLFAHIRCRPRFSSQRTRRGFARGVGVRTERLFQWKV